MRDFEHAIRERENYKGRDARTENDDLCAKSRDTGAHAGEDAAERHIHIDSECGMGRLGYKGVLSDELGGNKK